MDYEAELRRLHRVEAAYYRHVEAQATAIRYEAACERIRRQVEVVRAISERLRGSK